MVHNSKLYYLIDFLDDESEEIRSEIISQLKEYGISLENDLKKYNNTIGPSKLSTLEPILESNRQKWLLENWSCWSNLDNVSDNIESALNLIAKYHYGIFIQYDLTLLLDELAEEFKNRIPYGDELDLSNFLFQEKGMTGARDDYYNPFNSNAIYTIKEKKGLPITLCLIYYLIGNRLGLNITPCNFPGHFLARVDTDDEQIFIDCFNGGKILYENDIRNLTGDSYEAVTQIIGYRVDGSMIIKRVLKNLINSYTILNDSDKVNLFQKLYDSILN